MATVNQNHYRGRNDDGTETTATWIAAEDTVFSQAVNTTFRLRVKYNVVPIGNLTFADQLQYNLNGAGWNSITTSSSVIKAVTSSNVTNATVTTEQLTAGGSFDTVGRISDTGAVASFAHSGSKSTEDEFVLQIVGTDVSHNDTIQLRSTKAGVAFDSYGVTPQLTVVKLSASRGRGILLLGVG